MIFYRFVTDREFLHRVGSVKSECCSFSAVIHYQHDACDINNPTIKYHAICIPSPTHFSFCHGVLQFSCSDRWKLSIAVWNLWRLYRDVIVGYEFLQRLQYRSDSRWSWFEYLLNAVVYLFHDTNSESFVWELFFPVYVRKVSWSALKIIVFHLAKEKKLDFYKH